MADADGIVPLDTLKAMCKYCDEHRGEVTCDDVYSMAGNVHGIAQVDRDSWKPGEAHQYEWMATSFLFFEDGCLTMVDGEMRSTIDTKILDKHIVDAETNGGLFDFVFTDVPTCYYLVCKEWYKRADYEAIVKSLTGATFVCEAESQWKYTFNADGTMVYDNDGTLKTGTWWIQDARTINNHYDDEGNTGGWFEITYNDDGWSIKSIKDTYVFYPEK